MLSDVSPHTVFTVHDCKKNTLWKTSLDGELNARAPHQNTALFDSYTIQAETPTLSEKHLKKKQTIFSLKVPSREPKAKGVDLPLDVSSGWNSG